MAGAEQQDVGSGSDGTVPLNPGVTVSDQFATLKCCVGAAYQWGHTNPVVEGAGSGIAGLDLEAQDLAFAARSDRGRKGNGLTQNTVRKGAVVVQVKAGASATTGSQVTPAPDSGYVGLYVITVANAQTTITSSNIAL